MEIRCKLKIFGDEQLRNELLRKIIHKKYVDLTEFLKKRIKSEFRRGTLRIPAGTLGVLQKCNHYKNLTVIEFTAQFPSLIFVLILEMAKKHPDLYFVLKAKFSPTLTSIFKYKNGELVFDKY